MPIIPMNLSVVCKTLIYFHSFRDCYPNGDAFSALVNSQACSALFYQGTCYGLKTAAKYDGVEVVNYDMLRRGVSDIKSLGNTMCANVEACYNEMFDAVSVSADRQSSWLRSHCIFGSSTLNTDSYPTIRSSNTSLCRLVRLRTLLIWRECSSGRSTFTRPESRPRLKSLERTTMIPSWEGSSTWP